MPVVSKPFYLPLLILIVVLAACTEKKTESRAGISTISPELAETIKAQAKTYASEQIEAGSQNFSVYCIACHGKDAKGLTGLGLNLVESTFVSEHSDVALLEFIKTGRPADHPDNRTKVTMPPKGGFPNLTDEQLLAIIAHLRHLQAEALE